MSQEVSFNPIEFEFYTQTPTKPLEYEKSHFTVFIFKGEFSIKGSENQFRSWLNGWETHQRNNVFPSSPRFEILCKIEMEFENRVHEYSHFIQVQPQNRLKGCFGDIEIKGTSVIAGGQVYSASSSTWHFNLKIKTS